MHINRPTRALWSVAFMFLASSGGVANDADAEQPAQVTPESRATAQHLWDTVLAHCGDSYYFRKDNGKAIEIVGLTKFVQMRQLSFEVVSNALTRADEANGIQWKGYALAGAAVNRVYSLQYDHPSNILVSTDKRWKWSEWRDGPLLKVLKQPAQDPSHQTPPFMIRMTKIRGKWEFSESHSTADAGPGDFIRSAMSGGLDGPTSFDPTAHKTTCSELPHAAQQTSTAMAALPPIENSLGLSMVTVASMIFVPLTEEVDVARHDTHTNFAERLRVAPKYVIPIQTCLQPVLLGKPGLARNDPGNLNISEDQLVLVKIASTGNIYAARSPSDHFVPDLQTRIAYVQRRDFDQRLRESRGNECQ